MSQAYEVRQLPVWPEIQEIRRESRGTRRKFWISIEGEPNVWLLKFPRPNTGEHWAEKVAAEVASRIGVNCARVDLAEVGGELVTICESFAPIFWYFISEDQGAPIDLPDEEQIVIGEVHVPVPTDPIGDEETQFIAGCDVLAWHDDQYNVEARFGQRDHNVDNIINALKSFTSDMNARGDQWPVLKQLASYALLDGLVGNTDRHHENWELQLDFRGDRLFISAAPSYDHASSLGRELSDEARQRILDNANVLRYLRRGRGGVYLDRNQKRGPSPLTLALELRERWSEYTSETLSAIDAVGDDEFRTIVDRVPVEFMSSTAKDFAYEVLVTSKTELLENAL